MLAFGETIQAFLLSLVGHILVVEVSCRDWFPVLQERKNIFETLWLLFRTCISLWRGSNCGLRCVVKLLSSSRFGCFSPFQLS